MPEHDAVTDGQVDPPAAIGIMAPSDSSAMIALSEMIARRFSTVGKVLGSKIEKSTINKPVRKDQAVDRQKTHQPRPESQCLEFRSCRFQRVGF
jgi:hypothetical protein